MDGARGMRARELTDTERRALVARLREPAIGFPLKGVPLMDGCRGRVPTLPLVPPRRVRLSQHCHPAERLWAATLGIGRSGLAVGSLSLRILAAGGFFLADGCGSRGRVRIRCQRCG
jgi:hypothetical protein